MEKIAQKRTYRNKARELVNKPGILLEKIFDPELIGIMKNLAITDDKIRAELTGEKMSKNAPAPEEEISAKELIKKARSDFNRREYMSGVAALVIFNKKMFNTVSLINEFKKSLANIDEPGLKHKVLFENVSDEALEQMEKNIQHTRKSANELYYSFFKEAGILDTWYNLTTARGRELAAIEKHYPQITADLRKKGLAVISNGEALLSSTLSNLKTMASARATRKVDPYLEAANSIIEGYNKFNSGDKGFAVYYDNTVLPAIKAKREFDAAIKARAEAEAKAKTDAETKMAEEKARAEAEEEQARVAAEEKARAESEISPLKQPWVSTQSQSSPFGSYINPFMQTFSPTVQKPSPTLQNPPIKKEPIVEQRRPTPGGPKAPEGVNVGKLPLSPPKKKSDTHQKFYESLQSLSNEHPIILANYIAKYAKSIQETDLETAVKLFNIVKNIRG